jgi:protoporphyrinogen oxidase
MMGGENYKGILEHSNEELVAIAKSSVLRHMPGKSLDTLLESRVHVCRRVAKSCVFFLHPYQVHRKCIPQYNIGHVKRLVKMESLMQQQFPRIRLTGNSFYGVGVSDCIAHADKLVEELDL